MRAHTTLPRNLIHHLSLNSMARNKARKPLSVAPPAADSSSSDEESTEEEEEEEQQQQQQTHSSSSGEEEEEEEQTPFSQPPEKPSSVIKAPTQKKPEPRKPDNESDSDSDSDLPPPLKVKPIASKPMEDSSTAKKRPALENEKAPAKKAKTKTSDIPDSSAETQKLLFQRLWSEEDELVILKGMIDYKVKKEKDPMCDPDDFLVFIKKSLKFVDANKGQIVNKVQRLKKKYENNAKKRKITNPNELKAFELSKQVWGGCGDGVRVRVDDNGVSSNLKSKANNKGSVNGQGLDDGKNRKSKGGEEGEVSNWVISRCERELPTMSLIGGGSGLGLGFFNERVLNEGMKLLGERERSEMGEKLRKHNVAEMEVYLKRLDLVREVAQKMLNALKSA